MCKDKVISRMSELLTDGSANLVYRDGSYDVWFYWSDHLGKWTTRVEYYPPRSREPVVVPSGIGEHAKPLLLAMEILIARHTMDRQLG